MTAVAIDGPAGAGKTTLARAVARALGARYVDTGAMYRALALAVLRSGVDPADPAAVEELCERISIGSDGDETTLDGEDVSEEIRRPDVTRAAAMVARHPAARTAMVSRQRELAAAGDVVMEGRDIGTVVLPAAEVKIFLTASLDERARRRAIETGSDDAGVRAAIAERDRLDSERETSPLQRAPDAVEIDSTGRSIDQIVEEVVALVNDRRRHG